MEAAIAKGAHYLDSTGEGPFIRRVFEAGPRAQAAGVGLLTAMGYDFVPGNLAGGLALRDGGADVRRLEIGYFWTGTSASGMSGGTRASAAGVALEPAFTWRDGRLQSERGARRVRDFELRAGQQSAGVSIGSSEAFALPRLQPDVWHVDTYLGWFGAASRPFQAVSAATTAITRVPGLKAGGIRIAEVSMRAEVKAAIQPDRYLAVALIHDCTHVLTPGSSPPWVFIGFPPQNLTARAARPDRVRAEPG